jgi:hypothetical protein
VKREGRELLNGLLPLLFLEGNTPVAAFLSLHTASQVYIAVLPLTSSTLEMGLMISAST